MTEDETASPPDLEAFLETIWKDAFANAIRPLGEYLARFPGHDEEITREYRLLKEQRTDGGEPHSRLGPYDIVREIGRGAQATVFLARDPALGRLVALKVLDGGLARSADAITRFRREAEITSRLDSPGICPVFASGEDRGSFWIAMRHVAGQPLSRMIAARAESARAAGPSSERMTRVGISSVCDLFERAARTLHAAHEHGVIHRDIKPGNIMVTADGTPVILDFGLAQDAGAEHSTLTATGSSIGTPAYMSPEQIGPGRLRLDRRTDVYSLGASLFEALTLARPFEAATREGLYRAILADEPPDVRALNPSVGRDLKIVVDTALEKDRERRYQTALALADDLQRVQRNEPVLAKPAGLGLRMRRWSQRNPALASTLVVLLAAAITTLVLLVQVSAERNEKTRALESKEMALADYDRLGDASRLEDLVARAELLWPSAPATVPDLKRWLEQASELEKRLPDHTRVLERLRAFAVSRPASLSASRPMGDGRSWSFGSPADQFKHDTIAKLVAALEAFVDPDPAKGLLAGVRRRLAFAESVERESVGNVEAWAEAIRSIANESECPAYHGLRIEPQLGLLPIGRNPDSELWEFAHLETTASATAPIPKRRGDGAVEVTESTGLVFVLIPGGTFRMGAVRPFEDQAPTEPNVDPKANPDEGPVTEITLAPFFMSKFEMTQGQWLRVTGRNPALWAPGNPSEVGRECDLRHPVERVNWHDCVTWCARLGLLLPTEAQWEYAARGGTTTPWWTGNDPQALAGAANLSDQYLQTHGGPVERSYEPWNDGYGTHAPVGSFAPNPFGLHDVTGNLWEWCRDEFSNYRAPPDPGDGLRHPRVLQRARVYRGGGWGSSALAARVTRREGVQPYLSQEFLGLRPARILSEGNPTSASESGSASKKK